MAKEMMHVSVEEFTTNIRHVFDRVTRGREAVVVEREGNALAVLKPLPPRKSRPGARMTDADYQVFLGTAGGWNDVVDTDKLKEDIAESRRLSTRLPIEL